MNICSNYERKCVASQIKYDNITRKLPIQCPTQSDLTRKAQPVCTGAVIDDDVDSDENDDEDDELCDILYVVDIEGGMDDISWNEERVDEPWREEEGDFASVCEFVGVLVVFVCGTEVTNDKVVDT